MHNPLTEAAERRGREDALDGLPYRHAIDNADLEWPPAAEVAYGDGYLRAQREARATESDVRA